LVGERADDFVNAAEPVDEEVEQVGVDHPALAVEDEVEGDVMLFAAADRFPIRFWLRFGLVGAHPLAGGQDDEAVAATGG